MGFYNSNWYIIAQLISIILLIGVMLAIEAFLICKLWTIGDQEKDPLKIKLEAITIWYFGPLIDLLYPRF